MIAIPGCTCGTVRSTATAIVLIAVFASYPAAAEDRSFRPSQMLPASPELVRLGRDTYAKQCAACHGPDGRGDGSAAYLLDPKPRDLVAARYRLASTWERVPTDDDLFRTISRGMPGSAMPAWAHLPENTRWGLVHYVKTLAAEPLVVQPTTPSPGDGQAGTGAISVPGEPPYTAEEQKHAAYLFKEACASCHGEAGRGDGVDEQVNAEGYDTLPRDLTQGIYKGGSDPETLYRSIVAGLPGTPMPMNDWAYGADAWHLVHYVLSLSSKRGSAPAASSELVATKVGDLPHTPDDAGWGGIDAGRVRLMPLWWRNERVEEIGVQAAHDGERLALKLTWQDATRNDDMVLQHGFTDGAAVQFSDAPEPPLFAMGTDQIMVNIWHWKAVWEHDRATGRATLVDTFPMMPRNRNAGVPRENVYLTATSVGNPVAQAQRLSSVEDVNVRGFGSLTTQPQQAQNVEGAARRVDGRWEVVFVRTLDSPQATDVHLEPGQRVSIALAIWDGAAEDRNGQKSISIWQGLTLQE
jgi:mono/diheme cytochrome c family protein